MTFSRCRRIGLTAIFLIGMNSGFAEVKSSPMEVTTSPVGSCQWRTVFASRNALQIAWPANARSARLTISDGTKTSTYALATGTESFAEWFGALPTNSKDEKSLTFSIDYYTGEVIGGEVSGSPIIQSSQSVFGIGLVRGTDNSAFEAKLMSTEATAWTDSWLKHPVVLTPTNATQIIVNGVAQELDGISSWRSLAFDSDDKCTVTLTGESETLKSIDLTYCGPGFLLILR